VRSPLTVLHASRVATFAVVLVELCLDFNASVTSWQRSPKRNHHVGGATDSFHLEGLGADLVPDDPAVLDELVDAAKKRGLDAVNEGDHAHLEFDYRR
jgi:hypothetical protein